MQQEGEEHKEDEHVDDIYDRVKPQQREKYINGMAKFITWLKQQEEDDEDEEDEEDEEEEDDEEEDDEDDED